MPDLRTDAQLATAYLAGDRSALAGIYDRFSTGLYDTAAAMLRDRHEAADAMQDVFLIAAERMGQLREPERLKPWLYAILRNEVYRRSRKRGRTLPTDFSAMGNGAEMAAPTAPDAEGEAVSGAELAELVRAAACGLDERDQLVLELSVRQGLQGADLAAALGVSAEQSYTLVHRMRDRVDRSLGALVVARAGRKDCATLDDILKGWDGQFNVLIRKRVARHVEGCQTCERTKRKAAPIALLGAAPAFAAPPGLRDLVLSKAGLPGAAPHHAYKFDADGGVPRLIRRLRVPAALLGGTVAVLLGVGGGAIVVANTDSGDAATAPPTISTPVTTVVDSTVPDSTAPATTVPATTVLVPATAEPATAVPVATTDAPTDPTPTAGLVPGSLVLGTTTLDLGADLPSRPLDLYNPGQLPVAWTLQGDPSPFVVTATGGTLAPGEHFALLVAVDRKGRPEGDLATIVTFSGGGASKNVKFRATVEHPPSVQLRYGPPPTVYCPPYVEVRFSDETGIAFPITLAWSGPGPGQVEMKLRGNDTAYGTLAATAFGDYTYTVTVYDLRGNVTTVGGTFTVVPECIP